MVTISSATLSCHIVEKILDRAKALQLHEGNLPHALLNRYVPSLREFSRNYVAEAQRPVLAITPLQAQAYALYYLPLNAARLSHVLSRIPQKWSDRPRTVLDVGSGPGTALLALAAQNTSSHYSVTCLEISQEMRKVGSLLSLSSSFMSLDSCRSQWLPPSSHEKFSLGKESPPMTTTYDLVIAANVVNEVPLEDEEQFLKMITSSVAEDGYLLILEPALRTTTQRLMRIRDTLLNGWHVHYPCTHSCLCPMPHHDSMDWCHTEFTFDRPRLIRQLDTCLGFNKHKIKYSAFLFAKRPLSLKGTLSPQRTLSAKSPLSAESLDLFRVIRPAASHKTYSKATICGSAYFGEVRCHKEEKSPSNKALSKCSSFDLLSITPSSHLPDIRSETSVVKQNQ
jgi:ribosomal protein RSM22 (predicted rRNA methylase)